MKRLDCLKAIAGKVGDALVVGSAGGATVEWYHLHPSEGNFRSRTLGLASSIGLGIALSLPQRKVIVLDGDGSLLMNLCGLPTAAWAAPPNLIHIVCDVVCIMHLVQFGFGDDEARRGELATQSRSL
jgi:sulfopyruvate decarboxylase subunit beta